MSEKTWLDGIIGWEQIPPIDTVWCEDPAVDYKSSNIVEYLKSLDKSHLIFVSGIKPVQMVVTLPNESQLGNIRPHINEMGLSTACIIAFELCVRFPTIKEAQPEYRLGLNRLPQSFTIGLIKKHPDMVSTIGWWIIGRSLLSDDEKKVSSSESIPKTSGKPKFTNVKAVTKEGSTSSDAQNLDFDLSDQGKE